MLNLLEEFVDLLTKQCNGLLQMRDRVNCRHVGGVLLFARIEVKAIIPVV